MKICPVPWTDTNSKLAKVTTEFGVPEGDGVTLVRGLGTTATGAAQPDSRVERPTTSDAASFTRIPVFPDSAHTFSVNGARMEGYGEAEDRSIAKR